MKLSSSVTQLPYVGASFKKRLEKLGIKTVEDLLLHIPHRYLDFRKKEKIKDAEAGEALTISGKIVSSKNVYTKTGKIIQIVKIDDETGIIQAIWFNQPYLIKSLKKGKEIALSSRVESWQGQKALITPEYELGGTKGVHTGRLVPIYPQTVGISSKWLRRRIKDAFDKTKSEIKEFVPEKVLKEENLMDIEKAIRQVHFPKEEAKAEKARQRLAFNELLFLQLKGLYKKLHWKEENRSYCLEFRKREIDEFISSLPFELTSSQKKAVDEILEDLKKDAPMNRLLEGDVGSGKTVVSAAAAFVSFLNGFQTIFMAPTQILAKQHFNTLKSVLDPFKVRVSLVTSAGIEADLGKADVFVGTHALIHDRATFDEAALVVIDEQHRFGVRQRALIAEKASKDRVPHILTMTATPIPRTVALTVYNDLDLSTLDELPKGRKSITTRIIPPEKRKRAYKWIDEKVEKEGVQAFVICPLIEESQKESMSQVKAATAEFERLKKELPKRKLGLLHGRMKANEKNEELESFQKKKTEILVATPVVEVGIDVPNATIMVIEGAERFGLAQLHQLRGRVGRGKKKSYCFLFTEGASEKVVRRLSALQETKSGFELAELDLKLRGPGEVFGTKQHGFTELKIANWQDVSLIKKARKVAKKAVKTPKKFKELKEKLDSAQIAKN